MPGREAGRAPGAAPAAHLQGVFSSLQQAGPGDIDGARGFNTEQRASKSPAERSVSATEGVAPARSSPEGMKGDICIRGAAGARAAASAASPESYAVVSAARSSPLEAASSASGGPQGLRQRTQRSGRAPSAGAQGCRSPRETRTAASRSGASTAGSTAAAGIEALDYLPADSTAYRRWLRAHPAGRLRAVDRWAAMFALGCFVGLLGFSLHFCIESLSKAKARAACEGHVPPAQPAHLSLYHMLWR